MRKSLSVLTLLMLCFAMYATTTTYNLKVSNPEIGTKNGYQTISYDNSNFIVTPGNPDLPSIPVSIVLPPNEQAIDVIVNSKNIESLKLSEKIKVRQEPIPISRKDLFVVTEENTEVYENNAFFPEKLVNSFSNNYYKGYSIVTFNVYPSQINPVTNELRFSNNIKIEVISETSEEAANAYNNFYRSTNQTKNYVSTIVNNSADLFRYSENNRSRSNDNILLIITDEMFTEVFDNFLTLKTKQGFNPLLVTVQDIESTQNGVDLQDKIRNFIINSYQINGTEYVLLAGDDEHIPHRGFYLEAGSTIDPDLPSDLYYAGLDRVGNGQGPDWDINSNGNWGEHSEADYLPEVGVGRIAINNASELTAALNKQIMYQTTPVETELTNALMVGEELNDDPYTYGGNYKDQIVSGGTFDGYTTTGISSNFTTETLYDRDTNWNYQTLANLMDNGVNLVNHLGHSFTNFNMKFYNENVTNSVLTANGENHNFSIVYSQGCYPGAFDNRGTNVGQYMGDCIAEKFTTIENGIAAFVGNTRYGWYQPGGTNSSSQYMDRQFFDAIFGEEIYRISDANNDSKIDGVSQCQNDPWFRWTYYELTLFGDPTLSIWTAQPDDIVVNSPEAVAIGTNTLTIQTDTPNALIGLTINDESIGSGVTDINGNFSTLFSPLAEIATIEVTITAPNKRLYNGTINVVAPDTPYIVLESATYTTSDGDNVIEFGETINVNLNLRNIGDYNAEAFNISLNNFNDEDITIVDAEEAVDALSGLATVSLENAISFTVSEDIENNHGINISLIINGANHSSSINLITTAFAPVVKIKNINNNLTAGVSSELTFDLVNDGGADLNNLDLDFTVNSDFFTIESNEETIDYLAPNSETQVSYVIEVADNAPNGLMEAFNLEIANDENYEIDETVMLMYGGFQETFEYNTLSQYPWEVSGDHEWYIVDNENNSGTFSLKSGDITHEQESNFSISLNVIQDGTISFFRKTSCEADQNDNYDYLIFKIDGIEQGRWDGETSWGYQGYEVSSGNHTFTWTYHKDQYSDGGQDAAWIDDITLPPFIPEEFPIIDISEDELDYEVVPVNNSSNQVININNYGVKDLVVKIDVPNGFKINNETDEFSITIAPNNNADVNVEFSPQTNGVYNCELVVVSNDPFNVGKIISITAATSVSNDAPTLENKLLGNYPNPFNPITNIKFSVKEDQTPVSITIFDIKGRKVKSLFNDKIDKGIHNIEWNGTSNNNNTVGSSVYFYKVKIGDKSETKKMILLK